jgi:hypothetical protein
LVKEKKAFNDEIAILENLEKTFYTIKKYSILVFLLSCTGTEATLKNYMKL